MKADFTRFFDQILRPFIGTGIGNYFPFKECITLYARFSKGTHRFTIKKTAYDFMLELESGKLVDEMIIKNGIWEKGVSDTISKYLKKGDTFVDIGANIWYDTLLASKIVSDRGSVYAFEPSNKNFQRLERNIALNDRINIKPLQIAIGDRAESLDIYYNDFNPGETSLVPGSRSTSTLDEKVNIDTLDTLLRDEKIDMIKMDIEGFEPQAFRWMQSILEKNKDIKIIFEFSPLLYAKTPQEQLRISLQFLWDLEKKGFHLYEIDHHAVENLEDRRIWSLDTYIQWFFGWNKLQSDIFCIRWNL